MDLALILSIAGLVFVGMQTYIKRGIQGKVKDLTDAVISGEQSAGDNPAVQTSNLTSTSDMTSTQFQGGSKSLVGTDHSFYEYESHQESKASEDSDKALENPPKPNTNYVPTAPE